MGPKARAVSEVLPDWYERMIKSVDDLEAALEKHGVKVYRTYEAKKEIQEFYGWGEHLGYFGYGIGSMWKVLSGNMLVELPGETVRPISPQTFEYRDLFWHIRKNNNASWISSPWSEPTAVGETGRGPWIMGAEMKILDEKNILWGIGVPSADAINDKNNGRSASDENSYEVFKAFAEKLGYTVHLGYYNSNICFHQDCMFGLVKPGVVAIPEGGYFVMPDYVKDNFQIIETDPQEAAKNLALNMIGINEDYVIANKHAENTIKEIEKAGNIKVEAIEYQVGADFGTGPKCSMETVWRE